MIDDELISRLHVEVWQESSGRCMLRAVSEVFLNGKDVDEIEIEGGEECQLGWSNHTVRFKIEPS